MKIAHMKSWVVLALQLILVVNTARADFTFGEPLNLGPTVNSSSVEGTPVMPADGLFLYFDSSRSGGSGDYDVWVATRETADSQWGTPASLPFPVNSSAWDGVPSISPDGLTLFFGSYRSGGYGESDIWMTTRETKDGPWAAPVNLGPVVNSPSDEWTQSSSADGLELYFMSNRPGGTGGWDLWRSTRVTVQASWDSPVNLGSTVNSSYDDANPSISADGLCLFFFSLRPGGYGNRDIWVTTRASRNDDWHTPVNLGPPVNTSSHDQGASFSPDGSTLLFCSSRPSGYGSLDLMQVPLIPIVDFDGDGQVDGKEILLMASYWETSSSVCDIGPTAFGDGVVDVRDLNVLARYIGAEIDDPTLVLYWPLDESEGVIVSDRAGGHYGTVTGVPGWQPDSGQVRGALQLDRATVITVETVLNPADGPFSVLVWTKGGEPGQVVLSQGNSSNWLAVDSESGCLTTAIALLPSRTTQGPLISQFVITDGLWHRIALVCDRTNRSLYVDGVLVAQDAQGNLASCREGLNIGCGKDMAPGTFFSGLIDDVRIYNRAVRP
jgi:hypothetical protein